MNELRRQIELMAHLGSGIRAPGFIERFVLEHGHSFVGSPGLPAGVRRGRMKQCFGNAARLAVRHPDKYVYAEGFALGCGFAMLHAWALDRSGRVVEPTWELHGDTDYYGVLVRSEYVAAKLGLSMLDDWTNRWPLVCGPDPTNHLFQLEKWLTTPAPDTGRGLI